jgi:hypothetical protein
MALGPTQTISPLGPPRFGEGLNVLIPFPGQCLATIEHPGGLKAKGFGGEFFLDP